MHKEYQYKPPFKYLMIGLTSTPTSFIFFLTIGKGELWLSIVCGIFGIAMLAMGLAFLAIFIYKYGVGKLVVTESYVIIPDRWKQRRTVNYKDITEPSAFNTHDGVIQLVTANEIYQIEKQWMSTKNFEAVQKHLAELNK